MRAKHFIRFQLSILLFILLSLQCNSQETFFKVFPSSFNEGAFGIVENSAGNYYLSGFTTLPSNQSIGMIIKTDKNGNLISKNVFENNTIFTSIFLSADQSYLITSGNADSLTATGTFSRISVCMYDTNFNLLTRGLCSFGENLQNLTQKALLLNDSIIYVLSAVFLGPDLPFHLSILKYGLPFDSLAYFQSPLTQRHSPSDIIFTHNNANILVSYGGNSFERSITKILKFDPDLNYISAYEPNFLLMNNSGLCNYTDSSFLLTSTLITDGNPYQHMITAEYDYNDVLLDYYEFTENSSDTLVFCGNAKNTIVKDSIIWSIGYYNMKPGQYPWQTEANWIEINRLDKSFNLVSQYFYGGDAFYLTADLKNTNDGGLVIAGSRFDYNAIPFVYKKNPFILKVNSEGLILSTENQKLPKAQEALIIPNPGKDHFIVKLAKQHSTADLKLYDISGLLLFEKTAVQDLESITTENLKRGTYVYVLTSEGKLIGSGKWIKN